MSEFDEFSNYHKVYDEYLKKKWDRTCRKNNEKDTSFPIKKKKGETSPISSPRFTSSGANITDNEYEVTSEME